MFENFREFAARARRSLYFSAGVAMFAFIAAIFFKSVVLSVSLVGFVAMLISSAFLQIIRATEFMYAEREERALILASLSDGVLQYDIGGKVIYMNPRAEELFGVKMAELSGIKVNKDIWDAKPAYRALAEVIYPELASFAHARGGENFSSQEGMEIHTSRPELRLFITSRDIKNAKGEVAGYIKIIRDISHDAMISKIKSEFVSVAAHQLRTPLAALKWTLRLFLDGDMGPVEPKQAEFLKRAFETTERMVKLVNDLLNAARIEEGRFGYEFKEINYIEFIEKLIKNYELSARKQKVLLVMHPPGDLIPPVYADPERLSIVLSNLIENSLRYTLEGGKIEIRVSIEKDYIKTVVSDTGVGIPKEEQSRVFSKFFRASNAIRLETEGTGLGLFIIRNIVRRHGGEISFESEEKKGTVFTVLLPIKREFIPNKEKPAGEFAGGV